MLILPSVVLQPPSPKKAKVPCDDSKRNKSKTQEVKVLQATPAGIENQAPVPLQSESDAMDPQSLATKKGVSMTFNFHF